MDHHVMCLTRLCRVCGAKVKTSKSLSPKEKYSDLLRDVYGIDVMGDDPEIHPPKLCATCRLRLTRFNPEAGDPHPGSGRNLADFSPHTDDSCPICPTLPTQQQPVASTTATYRPIVPKTTSDATRNLFSPIKDVKEKKFIWSAKESLHSIQRDSARKRVKGASDYMRDYCEKENEDEADVLFFLLQDKLFKSKDSRYKSVSELWREVDSSHGLSVDDCLAMRVGLLETKGKYAEQYHFFRSKGETSLKPPGALDDREASYMPGSARFGMLNAASYCHHTPVKPSLASLQDDRFANSYEPQLLGGPTVREFADPNCVGVAWSYREAVAKTLEELDMEISQGLAENGLPTDDPETIIYTTIKDGADGMGDVSVYKTVADTYLPDKAFRASFVILKCEAEKEGSRVTVFEEEKPNAVNVCRPILEAVGDENSPSTSAQLLRNIEYERSAMQSGYMKVYDCNGSTRLHKLKIYNSMIDEKLDRSDGGLQGSGSKFLCTLCHATRDTAKSALGTFLIDRTFQETMDIGKYIEVNPDKLSQAELVSVAHGVKRVPLLMSDPRMKLLDATHADINLGQFFKKIIIREIAGIQVWEQNQDIKEYINDAEKRLNDHVRSRIGLAPTLMMPGNYARALFDVKNEECFLELIPSAERRHHLSSVLQKFRSLRKVYRALKPIREEVIKYKATAVKMGQELLDNFGYVMWPNYLHKVIEHVQEILDDQDGPGSIGALSGEGSEAANKLFRHLRKYASRRSTVEESLRDVLWFHWMYTSPKLRALRAASLVKRKYHCSICGKEGHSKVTCPSAPSTSK
ncbi:V(D)J recombination-activating protein 1-like [Lytechinus pictus]|uniref:V(D)J recombination-activating protein 1-like n=1 Tax=Lytechinus pictus TaxID=7653 RepID=UPI0030B9B321